MANFFDDLIRSAANKLFVKQVTFQDDRIKLLDPEKCRSQFLLQPQPTGKVCLFFHGFTSAPVQFSSLGKLLYDAGYNVLIPRMPGHGHAGDWGATNPPPLPVDATIYKEFALSWFNYAQSLGDEIIIGGLSGGGAVAAWLAVEKASQCKKALLFAPYFSNSSRVIDLLVNHFSFYEEWKDKDKVPSFAYTGFQLTALRALLDLGKETLLRAKSSATPPMFILSTETDQAVNNGDHLALFESVSKKQPLSWYYCFDRALNVPHAMLIKEEGTQWENLLNVMVKAYLQSELTWPEVEEIAYRMTEGKTFDQVVTELDLKDKASPDMPAMITMMDKRSIVEKRNPSFAEAE